MIHMRHLDEDTTLDQLIFSPARTDVNFLKNMKLKISLTISNYISISLASTGKAHSTHPPESEIRKKKSKKGERI